MLDLTACISVGDFKFSKCGLILVRHKQIMGWKNDPKTGIPITR